MKKLAVVLVAVCVGIGVYSLPAMGIGEIQTGSETVAMPISLEVFESEEYTIDRILNSMKNVEFVKPEEKHPAGFPYQPIAGIASSLAYGLARAEDCNIEDIKSAICIIDTALGKAGVTAVVRDSESAELASALILAADVIKVMGAGDVLAEDMAKEFEGYNNSLSSSISGHLLAEEIFNWARGILVTKASRSRD